MPRIPITALEHFFLGHTDPDMEAEKTPDALITYLKSQPPDRTFKINDSASCPMACFGREALNRKEAYFRYHVPTGKTTEDVTDPDQWDIRFAGRVDAEPGPTITAARALELLDFLPSVAEPTPAP